MTRTLYALLVGIDRYPAPIRSLNGCVNDVMHMHELLGARVGAGDMVFRPKVLKDTEATRQAIIDAFRTHLAQAGQDDVALFYYSGHGSQEQAPPEFWHLEPDKLNETIVCHDSRMEGHYDLADKELAQLIADISKRGPHVVIVLDCCHSGSGTRNADALGTRRVPTDQRVRPLQAYLVSVEQARVLSPDGDGPPVASDWFVLPDGRYVVLSACRADEESKEYSLGGEPRGAFSYFLEQTLQRSGPTLTYRDLFKQVNAVVRSQVALQSPQVESTAAGMLDEPFLGGAIVEHAPYFDLTFNAREAMWEIDAGRVHGIAAPVGAETTTLAVYAQNTTLEQMREPNLALFSARVSRVFPERSQVELEAAAGAADTGRGYRVTVVGLPLPPMGVQVVGDPDACALMRTALATGEPGQKPSVLVREDATGALQVRAVDGAYRIMRPVDGRPLVADVPGFTAQSALRVVRQLEHIARWTQVLELKNVDSSIANAVRLDIQEVTGQFGGLPDERVQTAQSGGAGSLRLSYFLTDGKWQQPSFKLKLVNSSHQPVHCALLDLTQTFGVDAGLLPGGSVELKPGEETWANQGKPIYAELPRALWERGFTELRDVLKLIVSTVEFDARLLNQGDLDAPALRGAGRGRDAVSGKSALNRLLNRVHVRGLSTTPENDEQHGDWATQEVFFITMRPQESIALPELGTTSTLGHGLHLVGHATLKGRARLTTMPQASREAGTVTLPAMLRDEARFAQPFELSSSRGGEPGLSVLELFQIEDHTVVQPDRPLRLLIDTPLGPGEHLLPVGHDGEFWLPLGFTHTANGQIEIVIQRLPAPRDTRSLTGSLRIMFQKIIHQPLALDYPYPLLGAADQADVAARVAAAKRILLFIRGIVGGTPPPHMAIESYDLLLTFDYENINTSIEETARQLKQRLADVGLGAGHHKTLHVVAHSMGGLVARWMIEHEGGAGLVQHLVMLGTPNAGSPWPTVQDWATRALAIGLNALGGGAWPAIVLSGLVAAIEQADVALDQMAPGAPILKTLAESPYPGAGMRYSVIAGDMWRIWERQADVGRLARLLDRVNGHRLLDDVTAQAFFSQPNDIAVSVDSSTHLPKHWPTQPITHVIACDHVTYFSTEESVKLLATVLEQIDSPTPPDPLAPSISEGARGREPRR